jgi:LmbE family N-acetylglucosaminyl deacetylase
MRTATRRLAVNLLIVCAVAPAAAQSPHRTIAAVFAHADDETSVGPVLARYAREGARVHLIIATDGSQGAAHTPIPRGAELAAARAAEARCSAAALGIEPPILLDFPDAKLGDYLDDPSLLPRLTHRIFEELQKLQADALLTWGPDGATGHPDHRIVSGIVTQLVRSGAPSVPERLFYASLPAVGFRIINPGRKEPEHLIPQTKYFTARVAFTDADFEHARRAMSCHRTQYSDEIVQQIFAAARSEWNGAIPLSPLVPGTPIAGLFNEDR